MEGMERGSHDFEAPLPNQGLRVVGEGYPSAVDEAEAILESEVAIPTSRWQRLKLAGVRALEAYGKYGPTYF